MKKIQVLIVFLLFFTPSLALANFPDVTNQTDYVEAIAWTVDEGITQGYENGNWGPNDCVTRAQLLKMVLEYKLKNIKENGFYQSYRIETEPNFSDVSEKDWHYNYIKYAKFLEIVEGYPTGFFAPNKCVNRVEAMKIAMKTLFPGEEILGYGPVINNNELYYDDKLIADMYQGEWYLPFAKFLFQNRLLGTNHTQLVSQPNQTFKAINFFPAESMSRKEVAEMLFRINKYQQNSLPTISYQIREELSQPSETGFLKQSLVKVEQGGGKETVLVENIKEKYGEYFRLKRGLIKGSDLLILESIPPETASPSSPDYSLNINTLEIKPLKVVSDVEHDLAYAEISPDQKFMIWIPISFNENAEPTKKLYLVDLIKNTYTVLAEVKEGESLDSTDEFTGKSAHADWLDNKSLKYAVYKASDHSFLEYRTTSINNPVSATYYSSASKKTLPYFYLETANPQGIFIYLHGAGGGYEQGMQDDNYAGNFENLKATLKENNFVYATPETSGFGASGGADMLDFLKEMKAKYGDLPIYLSGASAGGSTLFSTLNALKDTSINIKGVAFVVPAISTAMIDEMDWTTSDFPVWIEAGEKDAVFPPERVTYFKNALTDKGYSVLSNVIPNGDHNAPVEKIDWVKVISFLKGSETPTTECKMAFENFDPNPKTTALYGDSIDFKWNGPGCSSYEWSQYSLCFENVNNKQEFSCIGINNSNHHTLSLEDWKFIDTEMKTVTASKPVELKWYIQSIFGNALEGETLQTEPWAFSYSKN